MRRRRLLVAAASLLVVGGAVAVIEARQPHGAARDLAADEAGEPPAYPFVEPEPDPLAQRLAKQPISVDFADTPFADALQVFKERTGVPVELDPRVAKRVADGQVKVTLRVRSHRADQVLVLMTNVLDASEIAFVYGPSKVMVVPAGTEPPRPLWQRVSTRQIFADLSRPPPDWVAPYEEKLSQTVTVDLNDVPLSEAASLFQDLTGLKITISKDVDADAIRVTGRFRNVPAATLLGAIGVRAGCSMCYTGETIMLEPFRPAEPSAFLERRITLELRGAHVPELVAALESQSIPVLASTEAWASRGTFSVVLKDVPLGGAIAHIQSATGLELTALASPTELLAIHGAVPSVAKALAVKVPAPLKARLAELRADLEQAVLLRDALRVDGAGEPLGAAEALVHERARALLALNEAKN